MKNSLWVLEIIGLNEDGTTFDDWGPDLEAKAFILKEDAIEIFKKENKDIMREAVKFGKEFNCKPKPSCKLRIVEYVRKESKRNK